MSLPIHDSVIFTTNNLPQTQSLNNSEDQNGLELGRVFMTHSSNKSNCYLTSCDQNSRRQSSDKQQLYLMRNRLADCGLVGFRAVFEDHSHITRRSIWLLLVILAVGFAVFQIYSQTKHYLDRPVTISVNVEEVNNLTFPKVIICNENQERQSQINLDRSKVCPNSGDETCDQFYVQQSHQIMDSIVECTWLDKICTADDFTPVFTSKGVCFAFNGGSSEPRVINSASSRYGLSLMLWADTPDYNNHSKQMGFLVGVGTHEDIIDMSSEITNIPVGLSAYMGLQYVQTTLLPSPWGLCGSHNLRFHRHYSHEVCHLECRTMYIKEKCGCYIFQAKQFDRLHIDARLCTSHEDRKCIKHHGNIYIQNGMPCVHKSCPEDCTRVAYEVTTSLGRYSPAYIEQISQKTRNSAFHWTQWQENLVGIQMYMADMRRKTVTHQEGYSIIALLCDVGGTLGLLLGASVYTLLDALDFCLTYKQD